MRWYLDKSAGYFVPTPGSRSKVSAATAKRRDSLTMEIVFCDSLGILTLAEGATGRIALKQTYGGDALAYADDWAVSTEGGLTIYSFPFDLTTEELDELFGTGDDELPAVSLLFELEWTEGDRITSSNTVAFTVANDVIRGDEFTPTRLPTPEDWLDARVARRDKEQDIPLESRWQHQANLGVTFADGKLSIVCPDGIARTVILSDP